MIPKRAITALVTTAFALVLLFSFKTPGGATLARSTGTSGVAVVGNATTSGSSTAASAGSGAGTTSTTTSGSATSGASTDSTTGTGSATAGSSSGSTSASALKDGKTTGATVTTRFGPVQVRVTISGGTITDVVALQMPSRDGHSQRIAELAEPILRQEALQAQSAQIDLLSGATYTSEAYAESLQSALDNAHA
ncbi:MAG TPA: FMN-binding protein [Candidatus Limnocylindrales bacterium]|jgi:uncharacterized protein with FMN-binding domain|nr:FMN-binding protein [Candidatus Limnocylindrales bacterium]